MIKNYIIAAVRNLQKHFGYSSINIFGLGLGLSISLLLALWIQHELSYDQFHNNADQTYRVSMAISFGGQSAEHAISPTALLPTIEKNFPEFRAGCRAYNPAIYNPYIVKSNEDFFQEDKFYFADSTFFKVFSYDLLKGNPETALTKPNSVILTESTAKKYFAADDPIGKTLLINSNSEYTITGIIQDPPNNSYLQFDFIGSFSSLRAAKEEIWGSANYLTYIVLQNGVDVKEISGKVNEIVSESFASQLSPGDYVKFNWTNIQDIHLHSKALSELEPVGNIQYVYLFSGIALLILIIASINYINLATARASFRAKEVGVRKVVGATRKQLIYQFISESIIITFCSLVFAMLLVQLLLPLFNSLTNKTFAYNAFWEPNFLIAVILTSLLVAILSGAYPALVITAFKPVKILKGNFRTSSKGIWLRKSLVVFQFCVTIILTIGTLAILQQLNYIQNKDLGYDKENTIVIPLDRETQKVYATLKTEFIRSGKVVSMGRSTDSPVQIRGGYSIQLQESSDPPAYVVATSADEEYISSLGMRILAGRSFNENDIERFYSDTTYAFILNESVLENLFLTKEEAIGKMVNLNGRKGEVVGVVEDFHFTSLHMPIGPLVIFSGANEYNYAIAKLNAGSLPKTLEQLEQISNTVAPHRPFTFEFLDQQFDAMYSAEQRMGQLFGTFATLAIIIACLGLLGLVSFSAVQRTKEIGIRKVMGASVANIVLLITNEYSKLVLLAVVIAIPISIYSVNELLSSFAYKITIGPMPIILSVIGCLLIAFSTASYQALKAAFINPSDTLRSE